MGGQNEPDAKKGNKIAEIKVRSCGTRKVEPVVKANKYLDGYEGYELRFYLIEYCNCKEGKHRSHKDYNVRGRVFIYNL